MDPTTPLRIATRIHFALLRHYGENVAVRSLLRGGAEAREALWVCEGSGEPELIELAQRFRTASHEASAAQRAAAPGGHAPQDLRWSRDTSGFGVTALAKLDAEPTRPRARWLDPRRWLGLGSPR